MATTRSTKSPAVQFRYYLKIRWLIYFCDATFTAYLRPFGSEEDLRGCIILNDESCVKKRQRKKTYLRLVNLYNFFQAKIMFTESIFHSNKPAAAAGAAVKNRKQGNADEG